MEEKRLVLLLNTVAENYRATIDRLVYSFISKESMLSLNLKFLKHNTNTDIITFSYGTQTCISGEVFISIDQAHENATEYSQTIENELVRLVSHGFLHCLGFLDNIPSQKKKMSAEEDKMINMFHVKH